MRLSEETVNKLQSDASCIRNICILAHVDHGKTSLSDSLLATNGIISQRMAGKVRYLDSREDEQLRGITMESSAISLYFKVMRRKQNSEETEIKEHLINLIDSPGHIDFSSEVSTSSRLCDGAVVLVDVVEGVCSQTVNVLRQCWVDKLKPILVINKIDRLITEWKLTPLEAYQHISRVIEQVNSVIGSFFVGERMEDDMIWRESGSTTEFVEKDDEELYFTPEKNNVVFASAIDGWAFTVNTFAKIYSAKLGFSHAVLSKTLWGDFYLDMKNKKIIPGKKLKASQSNMKPIFVSLILEQIWAVYENCLIERNQEKLEKIIEKLGAKVGPRDLRSKDYKNLLNVIMSQWIPISHAILGTVIEYLPSPVVAQSQRIEKILDESIYNVVENETDKTKLVDPAFDQAIRTCNSSDPDHHTLAYVSKLLSIPNEELPKEMSSSELTADEIKERGRIARELARKASEAAAAVSDAGKTEDEFTIVKKDAFEWEFEEEDFEEEDEDDEIEETETLVGFTRIYSGSLSKGQKITVIGPKYDASLPKDSQVNKEQIIHEVEIKDLFLIMGRELVRMHTVPAGNIVGVVGLDQSVLKNATLTSQITEDKPYINLASTSTLIHNKPIMKIAVEPTNPVKLAKLERGLDLLAKADPVLEWFFDDDTGELLMCVAGELHLERCLKDLEERFAKGCEVTVKEPIIPFREGLASNKRDNSGNDEEYENENEKNLLGVDLEFDVSPIPQEITSFLIEHENEIVAIVEHKHVTEEQIETFKQKLISIIEENKFYHGFQSAEDFVDNLVSFGPRAIGPNLFVEAQSNSHQFRHLFGNNVDILRFEYENNVVNGVQLALKEGPLASEPLQGVIVTLKKSGILTDDSGEQIKTSNQGRVIVHTRNLVHKEILSKSPRLFLAMYTCDIQATAEVLGKVYAVVQKRGGSIISEEMKEGTPFFTIEARIPVVEAFGFSEDIRKKTSGAASPQLVFDGFDMLEIDPFWVPRTEEELEELGEFAERENIARKYMNQIRRRKGLFVDEKVVKNAEKQRTLKKD
ncbi:translation elongation factor 2/ribosome biogenesis protein RIA1 [Scheffersomyces xylosifermentans]|uniref:translation elongation factor 2/ribosome biogenesis protein RIA1 n=1 Tax=Scheffersomyces xylosifermentans TaxID=1304137 RepID=UPI00315DC3AA